jgi:transcriptional regulator with XRE-family HTH domain
VAISDWLRVVAKAPISDTKLRAWREERGLTQDDMVFHTGIGRPTYQRIELGRWDNPPLRYLVNCAIVLGCHYTDLVEDDWAQWKVFDTRKPAPEDPRRLWRTDHHQ